MKTTKILFLLTFMLYITTSSAQSRDKQLIDSLGSVLSEDVCRTIVVDNQPGQPLLAHVRVSGVDDSPIVIHVRGSKKQTTQKKKNVTTTHRRKVEKKLTTENQTETKEEEVPVKQTESKVQEETPQPAIPPTADNNYSNIYYGLGGVALGALLMSPFCFVNRRKKE